MPVFAAALAALTLAQTPAAPSAAPPPAPTAPPAGLAPGALPTEGPVAALIKTCAPDWAKFCQSPPATTAETVRQCFTENFDKLSEPCQSGIMAMLGGGGSPG